MRRAGRPPSGGEPDSAVIQEGGGRAVSTDICKKACICITAYRVKGLTLTLTLVPRGLTAAVFASGNTTQINHNPQP